MDEGPHTSMFAVLVFGGEARCADDDRAAGDELGAPADQLEPVKEESDEEGGER